MAYAQVFRLVGSWTPLILAEGLHGVRQMRESFSPYTYIADLKTMDGGYLEAENDGPGRCLPMW